ncbi:hypothetical protein K437DRAFT_256366 [Tilletiaria anomala UBC 951]|uniref:Protein transport protein sec16 n=1 Tax=Tilletiaria anomala (strain ATCC 24038 / CBS 436.72 / UBC 951) TaxID=1037660 RepID=A0A066VWV2_TILAU|nr:uncharacterized protein K437DRAFT_256366 [Tilletiaria anomala UBC 951]KDN45951.1 hypothetical protein K437DRAFT_256366 [Tilletiaria anomala UBC 951]
MSASSPPDAGPDPATHDAVDSATTTSEPSASVPAPAHAGSPAEVQTEVVNAVEESKHVSAATAAVLEAEPEAQTNGFSPTADGGNEGFKALPCSIIASELAAPAQEDRPADSQDTLSAASEDTPAPVPFSAVPEHEPQSEPAQATEAQDLASTAEEEAAAQADPESAEKSVDAAKVSLLPAEAEAAPAPTKPAVGHKAAQLSVANAASLFGDDSFNLSGFGGPETVPEEESQPGKDVFGTVPAFDIGDADPYTGQQQLQHQRSLDLFTAILPAATSQAQNLAALQPPVSTAGGDHISSPTGLFGSSGEADDWLNASGVGAGELAATGQEAGYDAQHYEGQGEYTAGEGASQIQQYDPYGGQQVSDYGQWYAQEGQQQREQGVYYGDGQSSTEMDAGMGYYEQGQTYDYSDQQQNGGAYDPNGGYGAPYEPAYPNALAAYGAPVAAADPYAPAPDASTTAPGDAYAPDAGRQYDQTFAQQLADPYASYAAQLPAQTTNMLAPPPATGIAASLPPPLMAGTTALSKDAGSYAYDAPIPDKPVKGRGGRRSAAPSYFGEVEPPQQLAVNDYSQQGYYMQDPHGQAQEQIYEAYGQGQSAHEVYGLDSPHVNGKQAGAGDKVYNYQQPAAEGQTFDYCQQEGAYVQPTAVNDAYDQYQAYNEGQGQQYQDGCSQQDQFFQAEHSEIQECAQEQQGYADQGENAAHAPYHSYSPQAYNDPEGDNGSAGAFNGAEDPEVGFEAPRASVEGGENEAADATPTLHASTVDMAHHPPEGGPIGAVAPELQVEGAALALGDLHISGATGGHHAKGTDRAPTPPRATDMRHQSSWVGSLEQAAEQHDGMPYADHTAQDPAVREEQSPRSAHAPTTNGEYNERTPSAAAGLPVDFPSNGPHSDGPAAQTSYDLYAHASHGQDNGQVYDPYTPSTQANDPVQSFANDPYILAPTSHDPYSYVPTEVRDSEGVAHKEEGVIANAYEGQQLFDPYSHGVNAPSYGFSVPTANETDPSRTVQHGRDVSNTYAPSSHASSEDLYPPHQPTLQSRADAEFPDPAEERQRARIPLVAFALDGKMATFFPGKSRKVATMGGYAAAYGGGVGSEQEVTIRDLSDFVASSSYGSLFDPLEFSGPAFDGAAPASAIARATGSSSALKAKKAAMLKFLQQRIQEASLGIGYLRQTGDAAECSNRSPEEAEDRVFMLRLLIFLLEHDGGQANSATFESAAVDLFRAVSHERRPKADSARAPSETLVAQPRFPSMEHIQQLLIEGKRKEAVDLAVQGRLFAHALVIASSMDKDTWRATVEQFISDEVRGSSDAIDGTGLFGLQVAYSHLGGQTPLAMRDLFHSECNASAVHSHWPVAVATLLGNRITADNSNLIAVGDALAMKGRVEAAHCCYLMSSPAQALGGADATSSRIVLLGSRNPTADPSYRTNLDFIIMTEILEFALGLAPVSKGTEPFTGLPRLQAFRLLHAYQLAELGEKTRAQKYCDAVAGVIKGSKPSPYLHRMLLTQLKELSDRLTGAPTLDAGGSWVGRKMPRATLDGVWGALEGSFTKFIAGEDDTSGQRPGGPGGTGKPTIGPFSHYSAITPDATSGGVSRVQSMADFGATAARSPPSSRAPSALGFYSGRAESPTHRASSALSSRKASNVNSRRLERDASEVGSDYNYNGNGSRSFATDDAPWPEVPGVSMGREPGHLDTFPSHINSFEQDADMKTPLALQFLSTVDECGQDGSYQPRSPAVPTAAREEPTLASMSAPYDDAEGDDDLGLGNSNGKKLQSEQDGKGELRVQRASVEKENDAPNEEVKPGLKASPSGSWLGRWWGKKEDAPKAKKAHLGEEKSFYYDPELKRWVNKKAGDSASKPATPPPPPRSKAPSPASASMPDSDSKRSSFESGSASGGPPSPGRAAPPPRARSNLADPSQPAASQSLLRPSSAAAAPPGVGPLPAPGPGPPRGTGAGKKKPIKSRYVVVD